MRDTITIPMEVELPGENGGPTKVGNERVCPSAPDIVQTPPLDESQEEVTTRGLFTYLMYETVGSPAELTVVGEDRKCHDLPLGEGGYEAIKAMNLQEGEKIECRQVSTLRRTTIIRRV